MDLNATQSYTLKKYTKETKKRIKERILNQKYENEINDVPKKTLIQKLFGAKDRKRRAENEDLIVKKPDKYLEAGRNLPQKFAKYFEPNLSGIPLEEIDDFYQTDYVSEESYKYEGKFINFIQLVLLKKRHSLS